jgi:tRNA(Ile)-lysidine synthase
MMLYDHFTRFLAEQRLDLTGRIVVGLSGGADSVVLVDLLQRVAAEVVCVHVNYGLRGSESDGDRDFVSDFCVRRGLELVVVTAGDQMGGAGGGSVQARAREIRYDAFLVNAEGRGVELIALAHHADDQVETVLLNLFRGAGVEGLAGMPVVRPAGSGAIQIVRPLLFARRSEIEDYAREAGLDWREDSSNNNLKYRRVALRHEIIPSVQEHFGPSSIPNILRMASIARQLVDSGYAVPKGGGRKNDEPVLDLAGLRELPAVVRTRVILDALAKYTPDVPRSKVIADQIEQLINQQPGKRVQIGTLAIVREREALQFVISEEALEVQSSFAKTLAVGGTISVPEGILTALRLADIPDTLDSGSRDMVFLDADAVGSEVTVSSWRDGDRISLLGSAGSKKVSDLLTDFKVPTLDRQKSLVVRSGKHVAWVVGLSLSARFAISDASRAAVMLCLLRTRSS